MKGCIFFRPFRVIVVTHVVRVEKDALYVLGEAASLPLVGSSAAKLPTAYIE